MSSNVTTTGFMAPLMSPVRDATQREDLSELLYDHDSNLEINIEGTLIYSAVSGGDEYGLTFTDVSSVGSSKGFLDALVKEGLMINEDLIRPYTCTWYNGSDSDMSMMTIDKFIETMPVNRS